MTKSSLKNAFIFYNKLQKYINAETEISSTGDEKQAIYFIYMAL